MSTTKYGHIHSITLQYPSQHIPLTTSCHCCLLFLFLFYGTLLSPTRATHKKSFKVTLYYHFFSFSKEIVKQSIFLFLTLFLRGQVIKGCDMSFNMLKTLFQFLLDETVSCLYFGLHTLIKHAHCHYHPLQPCENPAGFNYTHSLSTSITLILILT